MISFFNKLSPLNKFFWILLLGNILFIAFYFSGISVLQQIIAPTINKANFSYKQMREFGLLEMTQNILLLGTIYILFKGLRDASDWFAKLFFSVGVGAFVFLFLEELDYGLHIVKFFSNELAHIEFLSWHNQWGDNGLENATKLKRFNDAINGVWFFLIPLFACLVTNKQINNHLFFKLIPSAWFALGMLVALICSKGAHQLDEMGWAIINGQNGNLYKTIAEFRETSIYYLYFLYAIQLLFAFSDTKKAPISE